MTSNTGRRALPVEHAGLDFLVQGHADLADEVGYELAPENCLYVERLAVVPHHGAGRGIGVADMSSTTEPSAPARHERRDPRTFRMYSSVYERLTILVRELEDTGYRTDRTELHHALLHFELPRDPESARKLIRRFRGEQLD